MHGLRGNSALFWAREGRGEVANSDFLCALGVGRIQGLCRNSALFWAPEKAGVRSSHLIFSPCLALGTPENAGVT